MKTAICTGATGQDGSYLIELLLAKGYKVVGLRRRVSYSNNERIQKMLLNENFEWEYYDLNDVNIIYKLILKHKPDEIYNLAAQSHVRVSFDVSEHTVDGIVLGTLRILNAIKEINPKIRFYQASSSEMYGDNPDMPKKGYNEESKFMPASPYACAKLCAHNLVRNYRQAYGLHASCGILFNHESPRRGENFVTRKITQGAARIKLGLQDSLELGNLDAKRDWGYAPEYCEAMYLMLQQDEPGDYVISTGYTTTVRDFCKIVFEYAGLGDYQQYVKINPKYFRPHEVPLLKGDFSKAYQKFGWYPKTSLQMLAQMMYNNDHIYVSSLKEGVIYEE